MKPRFFFLTLSLLAVLLTSACASATGTSSPAALPPVESIPATAAPESTAPAPATGSVDVQAVATSRGPNLEATDPAMVSLASGQLQLVEFFRFT
ncbi:MAG: hypothetical protein HZB18_10060 [Chloroflexi bacterium]|nr:hypothetical protein [Chloroflexota bacterium]